MFATILKHLRAQHHLSQAELATHLGVTQQAVGKWEREKTSPDYATLNRIADMFEVTTDYLLGRNITQTVSFKQNHNDAEQSMLKKYRALSKTGKEIINGTLNVVYLQEQQQESHEYKKKVIS